MSKIGNTWTDSRRTHPSRAPTTQISPELATKVPTRGWGAPKYQAPLNTNFRLS